MTVDEMVGVGLSVALGVITFLLVRQAFKD